MDGANWAAIIVAAITVVSAIFSGRAAKNAAKQSADATMINSRTQAETEAYNRARKMDIETIERQERDIEKMRERIKSILEDNQKLHEDNDRLRRRVSGLEQRVAELEGEHDE